MRKSILILLAVIGIAVVSPLPDRVFAISVTTSPTGNAGPCNNPDATQTPAICNDAKPTASDPVFGSNGIVTVVVRILSFIVGFLAIILVVIQGFKLTISGGDPQAAAKARSGLIYALVGLMVAVLAQVIADFVLNKVG